LNFRSQPPLIAFFNHLFARLFQVPLDVPASEYKNLDQLGYVRHEKSEPKRELRDEGTLVELLITTKPSLEDDPRAEQDSRVLDARQLAQRILRLMRDNKWKFQATIEFEYPVPAGSDRMTEIAKALQYCKDCLLQK